MKKCLICSAPFDPLRQHHVYCSRKCRDRAFNQNPKNNAKLKERLRQQRLAWRALKEAT